MFNFNPYTAARFDPIEVGEQNAGGEAGGAVPTAPAAAPSLDLSGMLPGGNVQPNTNLTNTTVTETDADGNVVDQGGGTQTLDTNDARQQTAPNSNDNADASAEAAAAIVAAAAQAPESTAFEIPTDAIKQTVGNFDFVGNELMPELQTLMGDDPALAQKFAGFMNKVLRNAIGDSMVFSAELNQRHSSHLMQQQQALTQDQQLRSAITERLPEGATDLQINGAIATARGLRSTNPKLPVSQIADISTQLVNAPGNQQSDQNLDYSRGGNTQTQYADMRAAFGLGNNNS